MIVAVPALPVALPALRLPALDRLFGLERLFVGKWLSETGIVPLFS